MSKANPMSNRRPIHWGRALSDLHADHLVLPAGYRPARALIEGLARMRGTALVTSTGAFDRSAIMVAAVEAAKAHQRRTGDAWGVAMSVSLKAAWATARAARAAAKH